jgi:hypothetical protein
MYEKPREGTSEWVPHMVILHPSKRWEASRCDVEHAALLFSPESMIIFS